MTYGITIPIDGLPLAEHRAWLEELADLGYTDVWSSEGDAADAFTPLALAAAWAPALRLGTAIVPVYTRGPGLLAQSVASLADAAPGRVAIGVGSSSNVIVGAWNDRAFERPYLRVRDTVRFLRAALTGARIDAVYDTFEVHGFRLGRVPEVMPPLLVAALRPGMLRLAGREGDGAIINFLAADDVPRVVAEVASAREGATVGTEIACRIFVCPGTDATAIRAEARRYLAAYLSVDVYAEFHRWLGRGPLLEGFWSAWGAGDRRGALEAIPDALVDEVVLHGSPSEVRAGVDRYVANGVTTPILAVLPYAGVDVRQAARDLAPR